MNFRIPRPEDEFDYYGSSSQDETRGDQGGVVTNYGNDVKPGINSSNKKRKRPSYLDIGDGVFYKIPPSYDKLVASLNLPSFSDIHMEDLYLKGTLDLRSLTELMASDRRSGARSRNGMGESRPQYESLQAKVKALSASNFNPNFSLKVSEAAKNSVIPERATGSTAHTILSEGGVLQVHYVKVLEKRDTYETVRRSLPKKLKVKNDPAVIEKTERDKIRKAWINIVRRDLPKHYRVFTTSHRKQSIDAKRFANGCQREVRIKVTRSYKLRRSAQIRTRKISRDMLLFWKRFDKQVAEEKNKTENMDAFCDYVKTLINFKSSKAQIVTKLQRCKKKFVNIVKNSLKKGEGKETDSSVTPKSPSFTSDPKRILTDIEQAQALVRKLDSEKGIAENVLSGSETEKSGRDKLRSGSTVPIIIIRSLTYVKDCTKLSHAA